MLVTVQDYTADQVKITDLVTWPWEAWDMWLVLGKYLSSHVTFSTLSHSLKSLGWCQNRNYSTNIRILQSGSGQVTQITLLHCGGNWLHIGYQCNNINI